VCQVARETTALLVASDTGWWSVWDLLRAELLEPTILWLFPDFLNICEPSYIFFIYNAIGKSLCTYVTVRSFGCQYRSCH
jgi:hypothetical protein